MSHSPNPLGNLCNTPPLYQEFSFVPLGFVLLHCVPKAWTMALNKGIWDPKPRVRNIKLRLWLIWVLGRNSYLLGYAEKLLPCWERHLTDAAWGRIAWCVGLRQFKFVYLDLCENLLRCWASS